MESIINSLKNLFTTYGFRASAVIISTVAIVNLLKKPIVKYATKRENEDGLDKSVWTKFVTALPVAVAFVLEFIIELAINSFNFTAVSYGDVISHAVLYGALAVATYESVKKQLEAYSANKNAKKQPSVASDGSNSTDGIAFSSNG